MLFHVCIYISSGCSARADRPAVLDARSLLPLQRVSKHFYEIARDNELWRTLVVNSSHSTTAGRRRDFLSGAPTSIPDPIALSLRSAARSAAAKITNNNHEPQRRKDKRAADDEHPKSRVPVHSGDIDFYHEYIARHSTLSLSWLQNSGEPQSRHFHEVRGLGLAGRSGEIVVAPLDNDSVCLWNVGNEDNASNKSHGRILARSKPGIISAEGPQKTAQKVSSWNYETPWREAIVESVSVDKLRNKAYFAVQCGLNEVDLETLQLVSHRRFPSSICALSETSPLDPLTVATTANLHIHDYRSSPNVSPDPTASGRLDSFPSKPSTSSNDFHRLLSGDSPPSQAPLIHSPLSIVHFHSSQTIHVAGRFPSILTFDRRTLPKILSTIHSGARLSSLTSKSSPKADTLVACGEYNGKGSLELYRLPTSSQHPSPTSSYQNRTSAARSKLLSVASHGTRIVFCDGDGMLKWVEDDGSTLVRRWNINSFSQHETPRGLFGGPAEVGESDVARKILPLSESSKSELAIWTGEKIGIVGFRKKARFGPFYEEEDKEEDEDGARKKEFEVYEGRMRRALERQADEVRFVRGLGLGI